MFAKMILVLLMEKFYVKKGLELHLKMEDQLLK